MTLTLYECLASAFENGRLNLLFSAVLMSALRPEAVIRLTLVKRSANDPKRPLQSIIRMFSSLDSSVKPASKLEERRPS